MRPRVTLIQFGSFKQVHSIHELAQRSIDSERGFHVLPTLGFLRVSEWSEVPPRLRRFFPTAPLRSKLGRDKIGQKFDSCYVPPQLHACRAWTYNIYFHIIILWNKAYGMFFKFPACLIHNCNLFFFSMVSDNRCLYWYLFFS